MYTKTIIKSVVSGVMIFLCAAWVINAANNDVAVSLTTEIRNTESTKSFDVEIRSVSFRDNENVWGKIMTPNTSKNTLKNKSFDRMRIDIREAYVRDGALITDVEIPSDYIEFPVGIDLHQYEEIEIIVVVITGENLNTSDPDAYEYEPHLEVNINGRKMSGFRDSDTSKNSSWELILKTAVHQDKNNVVHFGPPQESSINQLEMEDISDGLNPSVETESE